ncbi:uncharacterized protein CXQ87_002453 [Candidozyma duobushaemuli]|uniref:WH1 domain-containing protein n=2 Tax=Candidozyma TaxID=3303203 RepID=A0ABX8I2M9_9ASCO|nr:uncharacterized protein CXQ87_002453 [[Candida] duobushaemulonis]PVH14325.1 hypothetical protein CXQ87_002453 [[Candida] duobushaemulonis]QWU87501.1 hypothetical protein CA3LBN_001766 [[Candida] haemuloni]
MGILTTADKEKVKRAVPKASNKIIDATVARLYIAHPDPNEWTYTGLVGAIALVDDLVGHTFFLKLVDILGTRGVVWDQELYVNFEYHQDRKFFHTFEIEDCLVGLLFEDTSDAAHFFKRVSNRQKYASKDTSKNKNAIALKGQLAPEAAKIGPRGEYVNVQSDQRTRRTRGVLYYDDQPPPEWRSLYAELASAGITEDMIAENREFIKDYIAKQGGPLVGLEPPIPRKHSAPQNVFDDQQSYNDRPPVPSKKNKKAPPPPPPASAPSQTPPEITPTSTHLSTPNELTPQHTQSSDGSAPHAAVPENRFRVPPATAPIPQLPHNTVPNQMENNTPTPGITQQNSGSGQSSRPPLFGAHSSSYGQPVQGIQPPPPPPGRNNSASGPGALPARGNPPPPPPARGNPPAPPPRGGVPPPPPPRANPTGGSMAPQRTGAPPPPPPRAARGAPPPPPARGARPQQAQPQQPQQPQQSFQPPLPPQRDAQAAHPAPPHQQHQQPQASAPPPPPMPPQANATPTGGAPPPPPPPPDLGSAEPSAPLPQPDAGRDALLSSIRGAGGIGALKKTDKSQLDKPSALLSEANGDQPPPSSGGGGGGGQPETLADALAGALNKRKAKVAASDDEDEDW